MPCCHKSIPHSQDDLYSKIEAPTRLMYAPPTTTQKKMKHKDAACVNFKRLHYSDNKQNISLSWHKSLLSFFLCPPTCFWCRQYWQILKRTRRIGPIMAECPMLGSVATSGHVPSSLFSAVRSSSSVPLSCIYCVCLINSPAFLPCGFCFQLLLYFSSVFFRFARALPFLSFAACQQLFFGFQLYFLKVLFV